MDHHAALVAVLEGPAPCDDGLAANGCAARRLACEAFTTYIDGASDSRWLSIERSPTRERWDKIFEPETLKTSAAWLRQLAPAGAWRRIHIAIARSRRLSAQVAISSARYCDADEPGDASGYRASHARSYRGIPGAARSSSKLVEIGPEPAPRENTSVPSTAVIESPDVYDA